MNVNALCSDGAQKVSRPVGNATVIIPTKNRPDDLALAVRSLFDQTILFRELIIVDQSSTSESRECVEALHRSLSPEVLAEVQLRYIYDPSIPGGAVARNAAMDCATGEYWVFLDDDVVLEPDFLAELLDVYKSNEAAVGVSGIITNYPLPPFRSRLFRHIFVHGPFRDERQDVYWNADRLRGSAPIPVSRMGGGLMSFRASEVRDLRFDSQLRNTSEGEDVEFCHRLKPGALMVITPSARLEHKKTPTARPPEHWLRPQVRGLTYLFRRLWNTRATNRVSYAWLMAGYALMAVLACTRRCSFAPWQDFAAGIRDCYDAEPLKRALS